MPTLRLRNATPSRRRAKPARVGGCADPAANRPCSDLSLPRNVVLAAPALQGPVRMFGKPVGSDLLALDHTAGQGHFLKHGPLFPAIGRGCKHAENENQLNHDLLKTSCHCGDCKGNARHAALSGYGWRSSVLVNKTQTPSAPNFWDRGLNSRRPRKFRRLKQARNQLEKDECACALLPC
jgi:hypothetical protein